MRISDWSSDVCSSDLNALLATILADATNLGLSRMAAASQGVTRDQLLWTHDAYIRDDSYRAALAVLINAHHRLPFSRVWGAGRSEEHTSELQSLMRISYAVFCLKKQNQSTKNVTLMTRHKPQQLKSQD